MHGHVEARGAVSAMAETRRANDGQLYTLNDFVNWYGNERGHRQWEQAARSAGAEQPRAEDGGAVHGHVEEPRAGAEEPGADWPQAEPRAEDAGAVHGHVEELGAGAEESGAEWPQASTGGDGAGAAEPGARDLVLLQLEIKMEDMARRIMWLEDEVRRLSGELEQRGRTPTRTPQSRTCTRDGCGRQYGPDRDGYLHPYCCKQCKNIPGSHGPRCFARCIQ